MSDIPTLYLFLLLFILILLSVFFSSAETSMMSLNRYRLSHLVKQNNLSAIRVSKLLDQPDRLIGVILIGNNFVNIFASAIATIIALRLIGDAGVPIMTIILTLVLLIFAEVTPKTMAVIKPEKIAFPASWILQPLLRIFYPLVWGINYICNNILRLLGFNIANEKNTYLSVEELKTVVHESGHFISHRNKTMLLSILDLGTVTVEDIMIPRSEIVAIDINCDIQEILASISKSSYTRLPVFKDDINNVIGILRILEVFPLLRQDNPKKIDLISLIRDPYFIPNSTPLNLQLLNFQEHRQWVGLVVNEYGDIQGMTTLEDILEEIVGEIENEKCTKHEDIRSQEDGSFFIDGTTTVREINKSLGWNLPVSSAKTLNGLITEQLEEIPTNNVCLRLGNYYIEIIQIRDNFIKTVRIVKNN